MWSGFSVQFEPGKDSNCTALRFSVAPNDSLGNFKLFEMVDNNCLAAL